MKVRNGFAAVVLAAAFSSIAFAQGATSPVAPRPTAAAGAVGGKVAVINTNVFSDRILELKVKAEQVNKQFEPRIKEMEQLKTQLDAMTQDIRSKQNVVPADKMQQMVEQLNQQQTVFKRKGEDLQNEIERASEAAIKPIRQKLSDFVKGYASQRNIILILDLPGSAQSGTLAYYNEAINITDDFIAEYNKANPVPGVTATATTPPTGR